MFVLTDLTRFKDNDNVCMALLDKDGRCYRPLPYSNRSFIASKNIVPGMIVDADVIRHENAGAPHTEDCTFENSIWLERADEEFFKQTLEISAVNSVAEAFEGIITPRNRCVPADGPCSLSIRTVRVDPLSLSLAAVEAEGELKLRVGFTDLDGENFRHTPISDLCFHAKAMEYVNQDRLEEFNTLLVGGEDVYIRVGLSRLYESKSGKQGYWMQANGIYVFPGCFMA